MLLDDEKNDGNVVFSIGMVDLARKIAKENIEAIKATGAKRVVVRAISEYTE